MLQKALHDWTRRSWFRDESCFPPDSQPDRLPSEWRLGNQANLRQMHDTARRDIAGRRVAEELVQAICGHRGLKQGAGPARVHHLPGSPRDVPDDRRFHCVLLGPEAASRPASPMPATATRFIDQATGLRSARNAVIVAVPHRDSLPAARERVRDWLAGQSVRAQLQQEQADDPRLERIDGLIRQSRQDLISSVRHAWSVTMTLGRNNACEAFHVPSSEVPLWEAILQHERSRIMEDRIEVDTLLPGGPNAIWPDNEPNLMAAGVVNAFLRRPELRKPLTPNTVYDTIGSGVQAGTFVARLLRPDGSQRQHWRVGMEASALQNASVELWLSDTVRDWTMCRLPC